MGHEFDVRREYTAAMGRGQAVIHNTKTKVNYGASLMPAPMALPCPRK